jgi:Flp pilus assembly protein TadG
MRTAAPDGNSRGATALIVSVSLVAIFGFTALSVDLGNAWQNQRELVNASDAAALAAAQEYALLGNGCYSIAPSYITKNKSDAAMTACEPSEGAENGDSSGWVLVTAGSTVTYAFAPVIGTDSSDLDSSAAARYGIPSSAGGLRPFGLCSDTLQNLPEFASWDRSAGPSSAVEIVYSNTSNPADCNSGSPVPGNWATMDFDGGSNSNSDIQQWTMNGYPGLVGPGPVAGDTGAFSPSLASELQSLQDRQLVFPLPIFDGATGTGSNAVFNVVGFVSVRVIDYKTNGGQATRSLTLEFHTSTIEGQCCDPTGLDTGTRVVQLCAATKDNLTGCGS